MRFAAAAGFVADDAGGQFNCPGVNRNPILLHQQEFLVLSDRDDDGRAGALVRSTYSQWPSLTSDRNLPRTE